MEVPVQYLAVVVAAVFNMALGFVWYGPLFGKQWMRLSGMSMDSGSTAKKSGMGGSYAIMAIGSLVMSFVLAHALIFASSYLLVSGFWAGVMAGFWNWLGFIAPVTIGSVLWDRKPWMLWILNAGYYLVALVGMGIILAIWK